MNKILLLSVLQLGVSGAILYVLLDREPQVQNVEPPAIDRQLTAQAVGPVPGSATSALDTATRSAILSELFREINAGSVKIRQ